MCTPRNRLNITHCNALHAATQCHSPQHTATHCNTLQHTATHCSTLQHTATHCNTLHHTATPSTTLVSHKHSSAHTHRNALRVHEHTDDTATHCNKLHTATHCNTLQHTAAPSNSFTYHTNTLPSKRTETRFVCTHTLMTLQLQYTATHCNTPRVHTHTRVHKISQKITAIHCRPFSMSARSCSYQKSYFAPMLLARCGNFSVIPPTSLILVSVCVYVCVFVLMCV